MPMGEIKCKTNCRKCIDCEPMSSSEGTCFRCYGQLRGVPLKKDFGFNKKYPPKIRPSFCPYIKHRK